MEGVGVGVVVDVDVGVGVGVEETGLNKGTSIGLTIDVDGNPTAIYEAEGMYVSDKSESGRQQPAMEAMKSGTDSGSYYSPKVDLANVFTTIGSIIHVYSNLDEYQPSVFE